MSELKAERDHIKQILLENHEVTNRGKIKKAQAVVTLKQKLDEQKAEKRHKDFMEMKFLNNTALNYFPFSKNQRKELINRIE